MPGETQYELGDDGIPDQNAVAGEPMNTTLVAPLSALGEASKLADAPLSSRRRVTETAIDIEMSPNEEQGTRSFYDGVAEGYSSVLMSTWSTPDVVAL